MTKKSAEPSCSVFFEVGLSDLKLHLPVGNCSNQSEMELDNKQELPLRLLGMDGWHRFYTFKIHLEVFINWSTVIHQFSLAAILKPRAIFHFSQLVSILDLHCCFRFVKCLVGFAYWNAIQPRDAFLQISLQNFSSLLIIAHLKF